MQVINILPYYETIVNYDKENGFSTIFNGLKKDSASISDEFNKIFSQIQNAKLSDLPDVGNWSKWAESMGYTDKELLNFLSDVDSGKKSIQDMGTYIEIASQKTTLFQKGMSTLKSIGGTLLSTFANMAIIYAASAAIEAIGTAIYNTIHAAEIANEQMESSFSAYQNAQSDVESVNNELSTTQSRIDELKSKGALTFVEQSELNKLQEANDKLQLQADLKEKEAKKSAKESAEKTLTAYEKNYGKYDLTNKAVNDYVNNAESSGNNVILASDEKNIASMLAYIQQMKKVRKESISEGVDSEEINDYDIEIERATDSIWSQVSALEDYKSKLEEVKETGGKLTEGQQNALNEINDAIELVYNKLDPEKYKQLQFDKIIDQARFSGVKDELINIAKKTDNIGISADQVQKKYPRLASVMEKVGITAQDIADNINSEAGVLNFDEIRKQLTEGFLPKGNEDDLGFQMLISKAQSEWNTFTDGMSDKEIEILYSIKQSNDTSGWSIEDWQSAFESAKESAVELSNNPITFSSLFASDEDGSFNKTIDEFQSKIASIDSALETLRNGEEVDLTDLTQQFPELSKETGDLQKSLSNLKAKQIGDFVSQWKEFTKELDPSEMKYAQNFMKNFLSSMDFTGTDLSSVRSKILSALMSNSGELDSVGRQQVYDMVDGWMSAIEQKLNSFDTFVEKSSTLISQINAVNSALSSQSTGKSISLDDFNSDELKDYQSALEYVNGSMQLNEEKVRELTKAKADEAIATNDANKAQQQAKYMENIAQIEQLQDQLRSLNDTQDEQASTIRSSIDALLSENDTIVNQCNQLDILSASLREATGAYQNWLENQNGSESGDMFDDTLAAMEEIDNVTKNTDSEDYGRIGKNSYKAAVEFVIPESIDSQNAEAVQSYLNSIDNYFMHDKDGNRIGLDVAEFCQKAVDQGLMTLDEASEQYQIAGERTMQDFADGLGLSLPLVQAMFGEMEEFGGEFSWADEAVKTLGDLGMAAGEAKERIEGLSGNEGMNIQIDVSDIENTEDKISTLESTISQMQEYKGTLEVDSSQVDDANAVIQYCIMQKQVLESPAVMSVDTSQVNGELGNALSLLQQFQTAQNNVELQTSVGADTSEAQSQVDGLVSEIQGLSPEIQAKLGIDATSEATIQASVKALTPEIMVKAGVDSKLVESWANQKKTSKGTVTWNNNTGAVDAWASQVHRSNGTVTWTNNINLVRTHFTAEGTVHWTNTTAPTSGGSKSSSGSSGVHGLNGTAHMDGTAHYPHLAGYAHAKGNWGTKSSGMALVGELGREIVVEPNGYWHSVGDNGAEFQYIPAGSVIFNHLQTEALLERGFVNSRGTAYMSGTAFVTGGISKNQANIASGKTTYRGSSSTTTNTSSVKSNTQSVNENTEATKKSTKMYDWVEKRLKYFANKTKQIADSITDYVTSAFKERQLKKQISSVSKEIEANQKGYETYKQKADSIELDTKYKRLVRSGDYKLEDLGDSEELSNAISEYENYYNKAIECKSAIVELRKTQLDLFKDLMNMPMEKASKEVDKLTASYQGLESIQSRLSVGQMGQSAINQMKNIMSESVDNAKAEVDKKESSLQSTVNAQTVAYKSYGKTANALLNSVVLTKKQKKAIQKAIKNNQEIDAKSLGLTGKNVTRAEALNKKLADKAKADQKVNDAIYQRDLAQITYTALKDNMDYALAGGDDYKYANHLIDMELANQKEQAKAQAKAYEEATKNYKTQQSTSISASNQVTLTGNRIAKYYSKKGMLSSSQIKALQSGKEVSLKGITSTTLLNKLKTYNKYVNSAASETDKLKIAEEALNEAGKEASKSQAELAQATIEATKSKFENIQSYYEATLEYQKSLEESYSNARNKRDAQGYDATESDFANEIDSLEEQRGILEEEKSALMEQLNASVADGTILEGSKEWYEFQTQINSVGNSIDDVDISMINLQNTVNTLNLTRLEKMNNLLSSMLGNLKNVLSLTTAAGKYNTSAEYQDVINTTNDQYDNYSQQADIDRENWNKAIANGGAYAGKSADEWQAAMYDNLANAKQALADIYNYQKEQRELPLNRLNDELSNLKSLLDVISSESDLKEAQGHYLDVMDYQKQIAATNSEIAKQEAINAQNQLLYQDALSRGAEADAAKYYDAWQSGISSMNSMKSKLEELSDKIRDDFVESVKRAIDAIGDIRDVVESEIKIKQSEGKYLDASDYERQIRLNTQEYQNQQQIISDRYQKYNEALIAGNEAEADQMLSEARQAEAAANDLLAANAELQKSIQNLFRDTIQRELDALDSAQSVLESKINLIKAQDRDLTNENYTSQIDMNMEMIKKQEALARENQRLYELEVSKGNMQAAAEYLQAWKSAEAEVNNLRADIEGLGDDIRKNLLTKDIDDFLDRLEQLRSSISTISGLINDDMMYNDKGKLTDFGITALALNIKEYESDTESLKALLDKRQKYIEEYNNGMNEYYSRNEFDEDMKNITNEIQDMLGNASSARQAIVEMITKTSKMEIEALNDVIQKRIELLQAQKDAYSFDKTLKSQTNDLTLLQKQKEALEGLTDKESQAKLQKLNKQIKDAQEELNDTITDHSFDLRIDGLNDLQQDISDAYDNYVKQLNSNLEAITSSVTDATNIVTGALGSVEEAITKILESYGVSGLDKETVGYAKQYANGTNYHPGGAAIVNDGNGLETIVLPDGSVLFPYMPKGSSVINSEQTTKIMEMMGENTLRPQIQLQKLNLNDIGRRETDATVNIEDIGGIHIYDATDPDNVMQVIHDNIRVIASDVGKQFSKNVPRTGTKRTWG